METKAPFEKFIIYVGTDPNIFCVIVQGDGVQYETLSPKWNVIATKRRKFIEAAIREKLKRTNGDKADGK